jgi:hypothetical protein
LVAAVLIFLSAVFPFSLVEGKGNGKGRGRRGATKAGSFVPAELLLVVVAVLLAGWLCCGGEKGNGQSFVRQRLEKHSRPIQNNVSDGYLAVRAGPASFSFPPFRKIDT